MCSSCYDIEKSIEVVVVLRTGLIMCSIYIVYDGELQTSTPKMSAECTARSTSRRSGRDTDEKVHNKLMILHG